MLPKISTKARTDLTMTWYYKNCQPHLQILCVYVRVCGQIYSLVRA